jgi:hypothetical protein
MQSLASDLPSALHGVDLQRELAVLLDADLCGGTEARALWSPLPFMACPLEFDGIESTLAMEDLFKRYSAYPVLFGQFRAGVTEIEAQNAARLQTLALTAHTLLSWVDQGDAELRAFAEPLLRRLMRHLLLAWNVQQPPPKREVREWAIRANRNYRLLPRRWRYL